jgi:hypothetical protein
MLELLTALYAGLAVSLTLDGTPHLHTCQLPANFCFASSTAHPRPVGRVACGVPPAFRAPPGQQPGNMESPSLFSSLWGNVAGTVIAFPLSILTWQLHTDNWYRDHDRDLSLSLAHDTRHTTHDTRTRTPARTHAHTHTHTHTHTTLTISGPQPQQ